MEVVSCWAEAMAAARKWPDERREGSGLEEDACFGDVRKAGGISYRSELSVCVCCLQGAERTNCVRGWYISGLRR